MAPSPEITDARSAAISTAGPDRPSAEPMARILCDVNAVVDDASVPAGARWALAEPGRQLDANLVHLPPGQRIDTHTEQDLDVLLVVVAGAGAVGTPDDAFHVGVGSLVWLPHGCVRNLTAGADGLSYLSTHRRRQGLRIGTRAAG